MIEIVAVTYNGAPAPADMRGEFGPRGGTLGRGPDNLLPLPDPARHVSRVQGRIRWDGSRFWIANVSDANPLFLNDEEIEARKEAPIAPGDELRVGLYVLSVRHLPETTIASRPSPQAPPARSTVSADAKTPPGRLPGDSIVSLLGATGASDDNPFADLLGHSATSGQQADRPSAPTAAAHPPGAVTPPIAPPMGQDLWPSPVDPLIKALQPVDSFASPVVPPAGPFSDLLAPDGNSAHPSQPMAGNRQMAFPGGTIPDDFDPFADPGKTRKNNSDDPLRDLASSAIALGDVQREVPKSLVDFDLTSKSDSLDPLRGGTPSLVDPMQIVDPMQLFGGPDDRLVVSRELSPSAAPMKDNVAELGAYFAPARAIEEPVLATPQPPPTPPVDSIPAVANRPIQPATAGLPLAAKPPAVAPQPAVPASSIGTPAQFDTIAVPAGDSPGARARSVAPPSAPALSTSVSAPSAPVSAPGDSAAMEKLVTAFLEGARASRTSVASDITPELMRSLGSVVYQAIAGAMGLISARQITKREIGAERTMILGSGNNPLKFLPTPEAALMQIFGPKMPGFMGPVEAMADAFADLRAHELGVIAGTRAALAEAVRRFDPKTFEGQLGKAGMREALFPGSRRSKLWILFETRFNEICRHAEDDFYSLYGKTFTDAYEEEVARHRSVEVKN